MSVAVAKKAHAPPRYGAHFVCRAATRSRKKVIQPISSRCWRIIFRAHRSLKAIARKAPSDNRHCCSLASSMASLTMAPASTTVCSFDGIAGFDPEARWLPQETRLVAAMIAS